MYVVVARISIAYCMLVLVPMPCACYIVQVYCLQEVEETAFHEWFKPELRKQG